jgi:hypothetical protein
MVPGIAGQSVQTTAPSSGYYLIQEAQLAYDEIFVEAETQPFVEGQAELENLLS